MATSGAVKTNKVIRRRGRPSVTKTVLAKIRDTQAVVGRTMAAAQRYKTLDIVGPNELATCVRGLEGVYECLSGARTALETSKGKADSNQVLNTLQEASAALSGLFQDVRYGEDPGPGAGVFRQCIRDRGVVAGGPAASVRGDV